MWLILWFLGLLWPPTLYRELKNTYFSKNTERGWGAVGRVFSQFIMLFFTPTILAIWIALIYGVITILQHVRWV